MFSITSTLRHVCLANLLGFVTAQEVFTAAPASALRAHRREGYHQCPVIVTENGKARKLNVAALERHLLFSTNDGASITMRWGGETRAFVVDKAIDDMPVDNYVGFSLLGKELSYDIDISTVDCSCNAALFFVSMPGYSPDDSLAHGAYNPYYCDANKIGGVWCWEHDTIESNKYTMTTTPHKCNSPAGGYISDCDRQGCATNAYRVDPSGMCPESHCKIDTRKPFRIHQSYEVDADSHLLNKINNRLVQGNSTFEWSVCNDADYLAQMTKSLRGQMKMVFQLWGTDAQLMSWLDNVTGCTGPCNQETAMVTFGNIQIKDLTVETDVQNARYSEIVIYE